MKKICLVSLLCLGLASCASPPEPLVYNARLYTVNNEEIIVRNLKLWEKNYQVETQVFHPRWRESLKMVNLDFGEIASAQQIDEEVTRVRFRNGREDEFTEFFEDEYNLKGWSDYGPFEISATLVRGLIFLDENGNIVPRAVTEILPLIPPPEELDRFVTFDGDIVSGDILGEKFKIQTAYGTLLLDRELISEIRIDRERDDLMEIVNFKNGDIISGWIDPPLFRMKISGGQEITMEVENLSRILFTRPVATEED